MTGQTIPALLQAAKSSPDAVALLAYSEQGHTEWQRKALFNAIATLAHQLQVAGLRQGDRIVVFAPNSPRWVILALATLSAGGAIVPVDAQMGAADLAHVIDDARPWRIYTTEALRERLPGQSHSLEVIDLERITLETKVEPAPLIHEGPSPETLAAIFYTSGTTGPPKGVPLTHENLSSNVRALLAEEIAHATDRVLLPLPLHHVYPFSIGLLSVLAAGATLVMPRSLVGPRIAEALRESQASILLGVPRLYEALWQRLEQRITAGKPGRERLFHGLLHRCQRLRAKTGFNAGRWLFRPVMKRLAPGLKLAVSGGAALDPAIGRRLQGLGWTIATGYGLTETSPILALNAPGEARLDTAGRALPGVTLRVAGGEVQAKGPNVFAGYWNDAVKPAEVFTEDGWFRTGDGGSLDSDGFLHLSGRLSATIVLPGGENIDPERIERALSAQPAIREAGVLEADGRLAAVILPEQPADEGGAESAEAAIQRAMQDLPGHHSLSDWRFTPDPLPRTRLGKLRRHRLRALYQALRDGEPVAVGEPIDPEAMAPEDQSLLGDPAAAKTWDYLAERYSDRRLTPDTRLARDLGLDSLSWVEMGVSLRERAGIELSDDAIGRVETVRDLLQEAIQAESHQTQADETPQGSLLTALQKPEAMLEQADRRALAPRGPLRHAAAGLALVVVRLINRVFVRIEIEGEWPAAGPYLITPRHVSAYDPIALTSAFSRRALEPLFWAGWTGLLFSSAPRRIFSRIARILPIDPGAAPRRSLALAAACLERGHSLIWFPEGRRGSGEELQPLRPGIGLLLAAHPVPVVPVWIEGSERVLPIGQILPRRGVIRIRIGEPIPPSAYGDEQRQIVQSVTTALQSLAPEDPPPE